MATFTWVISTLERELDNGGVFCAHWVCNAEQISEYSHDGDNSFRAHTYGTCSFTPDPTASDYIAYDDLTEEVVIGWVQADVDKDAVEASLQANIDAQITPTTGTGVPW